MLKFHNKSAKKNKLCVLFVIILLFSMLGGCSSVDPQFPPRFSYEGKEYMFSGHSFSKLPDYYLLLGSVEETLRIAWNYGNLFGDGKSLVYQSKDNKGALVIRPQGYGKYNLFLTKVLNSGHFIFVNQRLYLNTNRRIDSLPDDFLFYGRIEKRVYDNFPVEELTALGGTSVGGNIYISNKEDAFILWEDENYPKTYYACEPYH